MAKEGPNVTFSVLTKVGGREGGREKEREGGREKERERVYIYTSMSIGRSR